MLPGSLEKLDEKTAAVKSLLSKEKSISGVRQLEESEIRKLLAPWIGEGDALFDNALPVVIDISLLSGKTLDMQALRLSLSAIDPAVQLEGKSDWAEVFERFVRILQWLAFALVITIFAGMTLMITFSARASISWLFL